MQMQRSFMPVAGRITTAPAAPAARLAAAVSIAAALAVRLAAVARIATALGVSIAAALAARLAAVARIAAPHTAPAARLAAVASIATALATPAHAEWVRRITDGIMGTRITVELWADDETKANQAIEALLQEMRHIDESMSTYKPTSEVSQVNAKAADGPMKIGKELFDLLTTAREYSELTEGAFDITYASVGYLYDFRKHVHPDEAQIDQALPAVNYRHVLLDAKNQTVRFSQKGVRIDLGGIAKGYAVDRGIDVLKSFGFTRAYVSAGGDSRIIGDRFGKPWMVGIRDPRKGEGEVITKIPLVDAAISTSGDYERFFEEDGVRYHHIIDPRTGHSASKVRSATVIGPYATRTDGLSKTAFVLGPEKAMEIYNRIDDIDAIIVKLDGTVIYSKGLEPAKAAH
jgi:thiamine biosynthesis lipoprotein